MYTRMQFSVNFFWVARVSANKQSCLMLFPISTVDENFFVFLRFLDSFRALAPVKCFQVSIVSFSHLYFYQALCTRIYSLKSFKTLFWWLILEDKQLFWFIISHYWKIASYNISVSWVKTSEDLVAQVRKLLQEEASWVYEIE